MKKKSNSSENTVKSLILIDVQNDFLPGGALEVPQGDLIIPIINQIMPHFGHVFATQDWHPKNHISFASTHHKKVGEIIRIDGMEQYLWPDHCVQNTKGAEISKKVHLEQIEKIFQKGSDLKIDSYSAFFDAKKRPTGFGDYLKSQKLQNLYFAGLATDYCILYSVLDALELGFKVFVIRDACKAIHNEEKAIDSMRREGAHILESGIWL